MPRRLITNLLFITGFFFVPWWLGIFFVIGGLILSPVAIEIIAYGICYDALFGNGVADFSLYATFFTICLFVLASFLAKRIA
jgi:hypothetical protein